MFRSMAGLLAAVAAAMPVLAALVHGPLFWVAVADAAAAAGLAAYLAAPALIKKSSGCTARDREGQGRSQGPLEHSKVQAQVWPAS